MPCLDVERIKLVATVIKRIDIRPMDLYNVKFYPTSNEPIDKVFMYFLTMVAMDHRLSRPGRPYKAIIDGEELHGADLLYRLGMKMFMVNPNFFTPYNLNTINVEQVRAWLSVEDVSPPDLELRTILLRDLGNKILRFFEGDAVKILRVSQGYLRREDGYGLLDLLRMFKAYSDPVEKKSMLLVKFLSYRGLVDVKDKENIRIPVDNHLTRIAIRLGMIILDRHLENRILNGIPVEYDEDILIRYTVREAYRQLSIVANMDQFRLDDFLWSFGRSTCLRYSPRCSICQLRSACRAYEVGLFLNEHTYYDTWYY